MPVLVTVSAKFLNDSVIVYISVYSDLTLRGDIIQRVGKCPSFNASKLELDDRSCIDINTIESNECKYDDCLHKVPVIMLYNSTYLKKYRI